MVSMVDKEIIKNRAEKTGMSMSEYIRQCIFSKRVTYALTEEEIEIYKMLVRFNNDFERLANHYKYKDSILSNEIRKVAYDLKKELEYIRNGRKR